MAKGLDCGTSYYIAATEDAIKKQRNVFLTVDGDANQVKRMLKRQKIPFVEKAGKVHIVGQHAFNYAQIFSTTELKRPMQSGLLNPKERDALPVLNAIIGELLGKAKKDDDQIESHSESSLSNSNERLKEDPSDEQSSDSSRRSSQRSMHVLEFDENDNIIEEDRHKGYKGYKA